MWLDGVNEMVLSSLVEEYNAVHNVGWKPKVSIKAYPPSPSGPPMADDDPGFLFWNRLFREDCLQILAGW